MSTSDLAECYWLETHYPVDLLNNGHLPERLQPRRTEEINAFQRAIRAIRRKRRNGNHKNL